MRKTLFVLALTPLATPVLAQPKAAEPKVLASGVMSPSLVIDDEGVFFQEFGTAGIYMLPLPD